MSNLMTLWEKQKHYPTQSFDSWCQHELQVRLDAEEATVQALTDSEYLMTLRFGIAAILDSTPDTEVVTRVVNEVKRTNLQSRPQIRNCSGCGTVVDELYCRRCATPTM